MLVDASEERVESFRPPGDTGRIVSSRGDVPEDVVAAMLTLVVSTLVLFLVALIAAASFTVIAQRRLPQLGMMSAVGATEKHLRLTMLATGAATGVVAAVLGAAIGLAGWIAVAPEVEQAVGYRIDALNVPVVARRRRPCCSRSSPRRQRRGGPAERCRGSRPCSRCRAARRSRPALHRSAVLAVVCLVGWRGVPRRRQQREREHASSLDLALIVVGHGRASSPACSSSARSRSSVGAVPRRVCPSPVGSRCATSVGIARSGAALAAIALALGISAALVATAAAAENNTGLGNLSPTQLLVHASDDPALAVLDPATIEHAQQGVDALAAALPGAHGDAARRGRRSESGSRSHSSGGGPRSRSVDGCQAGWATPASVFVASPALLSAYGLDASISPARTS